MAYTFSVTEFWSLPIVHGLKTRNLKQWVSVEVQKLARVASCDFTQPLYREVFPYEQICSVNFISNISGNMLPAKSRINFKVFCLINSTPSSLA